jgi:hypothetical protein
MDESINGRIATLEANDSNIFHQLTEIKAEMKNLNRLTVAVEKIALQTQSITQKVDGIDARLGSVESAPSREYKHYKRVAIDYIVTAVLGIAFGAVSAFIFKL